MKRSLLALTLLLLVSAIPAFSRGRLDGFCENGNTVIRTSGQNSTNKAQGSFPGCTVTVYLPGTVTLATLYADDAGTPKANPFSLGGTVSNWYFYADNYEYDVKLTGGGISPAFTRGSLLLIDPNNVTREISDAGFLLAGYTFAQACTAAVVAGETLVLGSSWTGLSTQSCAAVVRGTGGKVRPASGQIISMTVQSAPLVTLCDVTAGGTCTITSGNGLSYPQWWGARGNGSSNDTAAIAAAIASVHAVQGGAVFFTPTTGCYLTDPITTLQADDHWYGANTGDLSCLKSRTGGSVIAAVGTEIDRIEIDHLLIVGTGSGIGKGISIVTSTSSSSINIHHVRFDAIGGTCLYLPNVFSLELGNIEAKCGKGGNGNGIDINVGNTGHVHDSYVYDVGADSTSISGLLQVGQGAGYRLHSGYILCTNCNGINTGPNWGIAGDSIADDGVSQFARFALHNANIEGFTTTGLRVKNFSCLVSTEGGKIEGSVGTVTGMSFDANPGCSGSWNNMIVTLDPGVAWANGQAIHYRGVMPFQNIGAGLNGAGSSTITAWDDTNARVVPIPWQAACDNGNGVFGVCFNHVQIPDAYVFKLGTSGNSTIAPREQTYGTTYPSTGAHLQGEIVWNSSATLGGAGGWICTTAGTPGTWQVFGGAIGPIASGYVTVMQDIKTIANGVNGCATAAGCWQINGVLGDGLAAATAQSGLYFTAPIGAGVYVRDIRIKTVTACTGTSTATVGVGTSGNATYYLPAATYNIKAAVSDTNFWPSTGQGLGITASTNISALSDSSTTVGAIVTTTGGNVNALVIGCEFKIWLGYWLAQ